MGDPKKIRTERNLERNAITSAPARQIRALEDIADTLEALRRDFVAWKNQPARR